MNPNPALKAAAEAFFTNRSDCRVDFFTKTRQCKQCHGNYSLYGLLCCHRQIQSCVSHPGVFSADTQTWSCCNQSEVSMGALRQRGCQRTMHDIETLLKESKELGMRYVHANGPNSSPHDVSLQIPIDVWLTLMYQRHSGSYTSFVAELPKYSAQIHHVLFFSDARGIHRYLAYHVHHARASHIESTRQLLGPHKNARIIQGMTPMDHTITLLVDDEEEEQLDLPEETTEDEETAMQCSVRFKKIAAHVHMENKKSRFEAEHNRMVLVYECK